MRDTLGRPPHAADTAKGGFLRRGVDTTEGVKTLTRCRRRTVERWTNSLHCPRIDVNSEAGSRRAREVLGPCRRRREPVLLALCACSGEKSG